MFLRVISALIALTFTAGFLGWVKSSSGRSEKLLVDEVFKFDTLSATNGKKNRTNRQQLAEVVP